jgi:hypothetical protein
MNTEVILRAGKLDLLCSGPTTQSDIFRCIDVIGENKRAHPEIERCLIDCRDAVFDIDTFGRFKIGEYAAQHLAGQRLRIALLARQEVITRVVENTAWNRGLPMFTTHDVEAAELWLTQGSLARL